VPIGKVTDIQVQLHPETKQILTPVFIEIDHAKCQQILQLKEAGNKQMLMEQLVKNGLRMQLQYTSLVTGQLYVQSLLQQDTPVILTGLNKDYAELQQSFRVVCKYKKALLTSCEIFRLFLFRSCFRSY